MNEKSGQEGKMDAQAMMKVYKKLATPCVPHKLLAKMAGSWNTMARSWCAPGETPAESTGVAEHRMILGGRYLQQECAGEMMGEPFTGLGFTGYDNHTRKYVSTWMDTMSTGIYFFEGTAKADGKTIVQTSRYDDPVQGPMAWRSVTRVVDDNTLEFEMYGTGKSGREEKMMEMRYTRK